MLTKAEAAGMMRAVADFVRTLVDPLTDRIGEIEHLLAELPAPIAGKDADPDAVADIVILRLKPEIDAMKAVAGSLPELVELAVSKIPPAPQGEPGASVSIDDVQPLLQQMVTSAIAELPQPRDGEPGTSVTLAEVMTELGPLVEAALSEWPKPKDGLSVTIDDIQPLVHDLVQKAFAEVSVPKDGEPGKDGASVVDALIDRDGNLVIVMPTGTKILGKVVGKDGDHGMPGRNADAPELPDIEFVPDDALNERIAKAVRLMAETPVAIDADSYPAGT